MKMGFLLGCGLFLGGSFSEANNLEELRQKLLFKVTKIEEFQSLRKKIYKIEKEQKNCLGQWSYRQWPTACYWLINNNIGIKEQDDSIVTRDDLDLLCYQLAIANYSIFVINRALSMRGLSEACKSYLFQQKEKLIYIDKMARKLPNS